MMSQIKYFKFEISPFALIITMVVLFSGGPVECAESDPKSSEQSVDRMMNAVADPFGLISGTAEFIAQPFVSAVEPVAPEAPATLQAPQSLTSKPNLNFYPYSTGYRWNQLTIRPIAEYYRIWDNNLFRAENGRQSDTYHRVNTGFASSYNIDEKGQNRVRLSYLATLEYFDRNSNQDHDDHAIGVGGNTRLGDLKLSADARWQRASSRGNINLPDPQSTSEVAVVRSLAELPMGDYFSEFELNNFHMDSLVSANSTFDRNELSMAPRFGVNLSAVDQLFFEYNRTQITYPNADDRDAAVNQEGVGLRKYLDEKTSLTGLVAYQSRAYDSDIRPDYYGVVASLRLQHKFGEQDGIIVQLDRKVNETSFDNQSFVVLNGINYDYRRPFLLKDLYLINKGSVSHQAYSRNSFVDGDTQTRREYVWSEGIGGEYLLPGGFATFYCLYNYSAIESNTAGLAIDDQQITYGFKGYF